MALRDASPIIASKNVDFDENERFLQYTIADTLPSKLGSLTLHLPSKSMSTPPALVTPSPRIITSDPFMKSPLEQKTKTFSLRTMVKSDHPQVVDFLKRTFFIDEPLNVAVKLIDSTQNSCVELESFCKDSMRGEDLSVVAIDGDGNIIGCLLGVVDKVDKDEGEEDDESKFQGNHRFSKIVNFLGSMDKLFDVKELFPEAKTYYDIRILSVDGTWRGQGLAAKLTVMGMELAAKHNVDFYKVGCSSIFSAKIMRRLGYIDGLKIQYADYKVDGQQVFYPDHPHTEYTICCKSK